MKACTWSGCKQEAIREQLDKQGGVWAHLCAQHDHSLDVALKGGDARKIMTAWVRAQGGAAAAARRVRGDVFT
jgi:hypothetical protein